MSKKDKKDYTEQVSYLLKWGFNCNEIAINLKIHPVTVRKIKLKLKKWYYTRDNRYEE